MRLRLLASALAAIALIAALVAGSAVSAQSGGGEVRAAAADPMRLPLGDGRISTGPEDGSVFSCQERFRVPTGRVAKDPPWIRSDGTWDSTVKASVAGDVAWSQARYRVRTRKGKRLLTSNNLPVRRRT